MTALTVRLADEKHRRLKALAKSRGTPLNRLIDDMTTVMLAEFDAETRFRLRAARGKGQGARGLGPAVVGQGQGILRPSVWEKSARGSVPCRQQDPLSSRSVRQRTDGHGVGPA